MKSSTRITVSALFGAVMVITILVLAVNEPCPSKSQYNIYRIILSLAVASFATIIPGSFDFKLKNVVTAVGGLAVYGFTYYFNPATIVVEDDCLEEQFIEGTVFVDGQFTKFAEIKISPLGKSGATNEYGEFKIPYYRGELNDELYIRLIYPEKGLDTTFVFPNEGLDDLVIQAWSEERYRPLENLTRKQQKVQEVFMQWSTANLSLIEKFGPPIGNKKFINTWEQVFERGRIIYNTTDNWAFVFFGENKKFKKVQTLGYTVGTPVENSDWEINWGVVNGLLNEIHPISLRSEYEKLINEKQIVGGIGALYLKHEYLNSLGKPVNHETARDDVLLIDNGNYMILAWEPRDNTVEYASAVYTLFPELNFKDEGSWVKYTFVPASHRHN